MIAGGTFQDIIVPPSQADIVVVILATRLGSPLPADRYRGRDGRAPVTGTEWEYEDALREFERTRDKPEVLVFKREGRRRVSFASGAEFDVAVEQVKALDAFWERNFGRNEDGSFKNAYDSFTNPDDFEKKLEQKLRPLIRKRVSHGRTPAVWHAGSPFRGLGVFEERHASIFFGRNRARVVVTETLVRQASEGCPFVLIVGTSGSGKSSLARAGVLSLVITPGVVPEVDIWRKAVFAPREGQDLLLGLSEALAAGLPELASNHVTAEDLARANSPDVFVLSLRTALVRAAELVASRVGKPAATSRLILLVDQLEELFTLDATDKQRLSFVVILEALARSGVVWVLATMRSDFLHRLVDLPPLVDLAAGEREFMLVPPKLTEIEEIIELPARAAGIEFETDPGSKTRLDGVLREAMGGDGAALPLLEFTLDELYRRDIEVGRGSHLTFATYRAISELRGAIRGRADGAAEHHPQNALAAIMRALVTLRDEDDTATARSIPKSVVCPSAEEETIVDSFIAARLLVASGERGTPIVRLAHEALVTEWPFMRELLATDREFLRTRRRLANAARAWAQDGRPRDRLLPEGRPLEEARDVFDTRRKDLATEPDLLPFVKASIAADKERRKRRRTELKEAQKRAEAERQLRRSAERRLELLQRSMRSSRVAAIPLDQEPLRALKELDRVEHPGQHRDFAWRLLRAYFVRRAPCVIKAVGPAMAFDRELCAAGDGGAVAIIDPINRTVIRELIADMPLTQIDVIAVCSNTRRVAALTRSGSLTVWDSGNGRVVRRFDVDSGWLKRMSFGPAPDLEFRGGRLFARRDDRLLIWDPDSTELVSIELKDGHLPFDTSDGGETLAGVNEDAEISVWDALGGFPSLTLGQLHQEAVLDLRFTTEGSLIAVLVGSDKRGVEARRFEARKWMDPEWTHESSEAPIHRPPTQKSC
jgi:hypothetical protein